MQRQSSSDVPTFNTTKVGSDMLLPVRAVASGIAAALMLTAIVAVIATIAA